MKQEVSSETYFEQACTLLPGGVNSPVRAFHHVNRTPVYFSRAKGPFLFDVEGRQYVDFCLAFGPHLLGHGHPEVIGTVKEQLERGTSFGACHPQEITLAQKLISAYPFFDKVRLVSSGTEAVMTALRLARGFTGRDGILKFEGCYHGHSDNLLVKSGSSVAGLPESSSKGVGRSAIQDTIVARLDQKDSIEEAFRKRGKDIAAVIVEPIPANFGLWIPSANDLSWLMDLAHEHGALLIFDEVITGFRLGLSGACGYFDLQPDLVVTGKVLGGGFPLAAVIGPKKIMDRLAPAGDVYQAGTMAGNILSVSAGNAVLDILLREQPYQRLEQETSFLAKALTDILQRSAPVQVHHVGSLFWVQFGTGDCFPPNVDEHAKRKYSEFFSFCLGQGIYLPPSPYEVGFLSTAHSHEILESVVEKLIRWKK
ncbi:MAG: glutamate-1-semialdehyde 2,1-aminomutase [Deltaproteobacteria bacterium]|nr:glutamate-1-semialdehyde 2,1-aminomutase [Deltaproteobacteria bacterium]